MCRITTFMLLFTSILFSQEKNEAAFNFAIENGYNNSSSLIPITVVDNATKKEKFYLSSAESLYRAIEIEYGIKSQDSLESIIRKKSVSQVFEFKNIEALNALGFYNKNSIDVSKINKIDKFIKKKKIINGLENLKNQTLINRKLLDDFSKLRYGIKDSIIKANPNLTTQQIKFLEHLTFETYSPDSSIKDFGNMSDFEGADNVLELWKKATANQWQEITKNLKIRDKLFEKYVQKYQKKFWNNYLVALFKYGVVFYVSDLNGALELDGIVK